MKNTLVALAFYLSVTAVRGQVFQKIIGGVEKDFCTYSEKTIDGGFIMIGSTQSYGAANGGYILDVYLVKTDYIGNIEWTKTFGDINRDDGMFVHQTNDGGYILTGWGDSEADGNLKCYLIKTNSLGNVIWKKAIEGNDINAAGWIGHCVQQTRDGGYIVVGKKDTFGSSDDVFLFKTNAIGNVLWSRDIDSTGNSVGTTILQTSDNGYMITGYTQNNGAGGYDVYLMKTDSLGIPIWGKTYGGLNYDTGWSLQPTNDGGFIMPASTQSFGSGDYDMYLIKTDSLGNPDWTKTYGGAKKDVALFAKQTLDGGYIVTGSTKSFNIDSSDVYVVKTDNMGNILWSKTYGGIGQEQGNTVSETNDGGYMVIGWTNSFGIGVMKIYLIKTDSTGNSGCNETNPPTQSTIAPTQVSNMTLQVTSGYVSVNASLVVHTGGASNTLCYTGIREEQSESSEIMISPNPNSGQMTLSYTLAQAAELSIYDMQGRRLITYTLLPNNQTLNLNLDQLNAGIYYYNLHTHDNQLKTEKLVIVK